MDCVSSSIIEKACYVAFAMQAFRSSTLKVFKDLCSLFGRWAMIFSVTTVVVVASWIIFTVARKVPASSGLRALLIFATVDSFITGGLMGYVKSVLLALLWVAGFGVVMMASSLSQLRHEETAVSVEKEQRRDSRKRPTPNEGFWKGFAVIPMDTIAWKSASRLERLLLLLKVRKSF